VHILLSQLDEINSAACRCGDHVEQTLAALTLRSGKPKSISDVVEKQGSQWPVVSSQLLVTRGDVW